MTLKLKPNDVKFRRVKIVGTRTSDVIGYIGTTSHFELEIRIEKVGGNQS